MIVLLVTYHNTRRHDNEDGLEDNQEISVWTIIINYNLILKVGTYFC